MKINVVKEQLKDNLSTVLSHDHCRHNIIKGHGACMLPNYLHFSVTLHKEEFCVVRLSYI